MDGAEKKVSEELDVGKIYIEKPDIELFNGNNVPQIKRFNDTSKKWESLTKEDNNRLLNDIETKFFIEKTEETNKNKDVMYMIELNEDNDIIENYIYNSNTNKWKEKQEYYDFAKDGI